MAKRCGLTQARIGRIWRGFRLQPHRVEGFKTRQGSSVHRQGARYRRALPRPATYADLHGLSGRTLVRGADRETVAPPGPPHHRRTPEYHPLLIWNSKAASLSLRVDANR
jgi:hypothetical protein